jgi:hypothetical protein
MIEERLPVPPFGKGCPARQMVGQKRSETGEEPRAWSRAFQVCEGNVGRVSSGRGWKKWRIKGKGHRLLAATNKARFRHQANKRGP